MAIPAIHEARDMALTEPRVVVRRTCPAGHTYISGTNADPVLLAAWVAAHETHEETKA
jgi:hypothetical protein